MKVFMCRRSGGYSGGLIVVASNSKEEAFEVFANSDKYGWMVNKFDFETCEFVEEPSLWHSYDYPRDMFFEVPNLIANVDEPCVIEECGYTE